MLFHAAWRSLLLIWLGIYLRSVGRSQLNFTFEDVLTQIGLGYTFLFLLAWLKPRYQALAAALILFAYWLAFALYPLPPEGFNYASVGVPADWPHHLHGFAAHWDKNTNFAARADQWFLNLFPRPKPFAYNAGGYLTLSFIPSLATMILGMLAGNHLRCTMRSPARKALNLLLAGLAFLVFGFTLDRLGICPIVKRIWTPAWTIFAAGWTCVLLSAFYAVIDIRGWRAWSFPLIVVGMNSIAMYFLAHAPLQPVMRELIQLHFPDKTFTLFGQPYAPLVQGTLVLLTLWLICLWMYRRKIFLRI
jgi:predicted acyltransferase